MLAVARRASALRSSTVAPVKARPALACLAQCRWHGQEINPILHRLHHEEDGKSVPFDRSLMRTWSHVFYAPHESGSWGMDQHYAPYTLQYLRLNDYLAGYLHGRVLFSAPQVFRTVAGNLVRLFVYQPTGVGVQWSAVEAALARVFGQYQGPGTSGRAPDDNEREGRVKTRLEVVSLASPLLNADILAQYVGRALLDRVTPTAIYDRLAMVVDDTTTKRSRETGLSALPIAGFRLRIRGRPRGEEMATRHDFLKGSCPKRDQDALIDFGKYAVQGRSGVVGVKAWVHFQKPHREDLTGERQLLHLLGATVEEDEDDYDEATRLEQPFGQPHAGGDAALLKALGGGGESAGITSASHRSEAERTNNDSNDDEEKRKRYHPLNLFATDRDYDPAEKIPVLNDRGRGLWNVNNSNDPEVSSLVRTLKTLHTPDHAPASRFIW